MSGLEIALMLIILFFSGVWGGIKYVDERTDNKLVFFIPAFLLALFISSGIGEGVAFYACLSAFGPIVVMLLFVGFQQGKTPMIGRTSAPTDYRGYPIRRPLDLNRSLSPGYIRSYDRLIDFLQVKGGEIRSREDGQRRLEQYGIENRFLSSPYVIKILGIQEENNSRDSSEEVGDDWWEEGYDSDKESRAKADAFKAGTHVGSSSTPNVEYCGHPGCSAEVTAFDFRCYTCRNRFCSDHAGSGIDCNNCTK